MILETPWHNMPNIEKLKPYERLIEKFFDSESLRIYKNAVENAKNQFNFPQKLISEFSSSFIRSFSNVLIYGKKERGKKLSEYCIQSGVHVKGFVISDGRKSMEEYNEPVPQIV